VLFILEKFQCNWEKKWFN